MSDPSQFLLTRLTEGDPRPVTAISPLDEAPPVPGGLPGPAGGIVEPWQPPAGWQPGQAGQAGQPVKPPQEGKKPSKPGSGGSVVYDPYGGLTEPDSRVVRARIMEEYYARPGVQRPLPTYEYAPYVKPTRGPIATVNVLPAHVIEDQAFQQQIRCMSGSDLNALFNQLLEQQRVIESGPRNRAAINQLHKLKWLLSSINIQKQAPKACEGGSPVPPSSVLPSLTSVDTPIAQAPKTGLTVTTMPGYYRGAAGAEVDLEAPLADLYSIYGEREMSREMAELKKGRTSLSAFAEAEELMSEPFEMPTMASSTEGSVLEQVEATRLATEGAPVPITAKTPVRGGDVSPVMKLILAGGAVWLGLLLFKK